MSALFREAIAQRVRSSALVAVVVLRELETAVPLARALVAGGIDVIELTLRSPAALPALAAIKREVPELLIGAGTVLTPEDLHAARDAGANFAVSPGVNPRVLEEAARLEFSFAPGVATPTDIETAVNLGCRLLKFFPAEQIGGLPYFRAVIAPYEHLGVEYIPLGGLNEQLMSAYLSLPSVAAIGGSWMATAELIRSAQWNKITELSLQAVGTAQRLRAGSK